MNLQRTALTDLLPGVREGFHSAILTTFSFDFYFFEMILLRRLRAIGVRNVVVLADAAMLHEATRFSSGFGSPRTKTYSLVPIDCGGGAFHPKMLCLFGEKSGWMTVGSGNLTEAGFGKNDEAWGAFYFSKNCAEHANLFAGAWDFIQFLNKKHLVGFAKKQVADAAQFAPWLADLPRFDAENWSKTAGDCQIKLIRAGGEKTVWAQLLANLPTGDVHQITVVSPFFEVRGTWLAKLSGGFSGAKIRVVVEPEWAQLPLKLDENTQKRLQFFDWKIITGATERAGNRWLHAKIFIFETRTLGSFCFFGSSNATEAGFGNSGSNLEANLILHSPTEDFFKTLGLEIDPEFAKNLSDLVAAAPENRLPATGNSGFEIFIAAAELDERRLRILISKPSDAPARLVLFDAEGLELQSAETVFDRAGEVDFKFSNKNGLFSCQICHRETAAPLSNRQVVAHVADLQKTNPDPARAKFEELLDRMRDGENAAIADILSLIYLEMPQPSEQIREHGLRIEQPQFVFENGGNAPPDVELTVEEFTRIADERVYRSHFLQFDPARDLSDFLLQIGLNQTAATSETDGDEELLDAETGERKDGATVAGSKKPKAETTDREAEKVKAFLGRYRKVLQKNVDQFLALAKQNTPPEPLTARELSHFLIALRLMVRYADRRAAERQNEAAAFPFRQKTKAVWNPKKVESAQVACFEIVGKMLLLFNSGIREPQTVREQNRLFLLKENIFFDSIFLFAHALSEKDGDYFYLLVLNLLLHFQEILPLDAARLKTEMERRGNFGSGFFPEVFRKFEPDFQRLAAFFQDHFAGKDLKMRHRISASEDQFWLLEKQFGISLTDKKLSQRQHPGGTCDAEAEYFLAV